MVAEWLKPQGWRGTALAASRNGPGAAGLRHPDGHDLGRRCYTRLMDAVDTVLDNLEELHLRDRHQVPTAYTAYLEHLTAMLPADVRCELRTGIPIVRLMETLYDIQGKLMARRSERMVDRVASSRRLERPASIPGFVG
jgi:hypothetical protein